MSYNPEMNKWEYDYNRPYNPGWSWTHNRRKHQRKINKAMRLMNKNIENDSLWRGRFCIRSGQTIFQRYEDNSGSELLCELLFIDKKTHKIVREYDTVNNWCNLNGHQIARRMNQFIIEDCDVWSEDPGPKYDTIDYRNI